MYKDVVEEGHNVQVFLNADAVSLIRKPVLDSLVGLGTGKTREHFDILVEAKVPIYVSAIFRNQRCDRKRSKGDKFNKSFP